MSIYSGFEGYQDPTEEDALAALDTHIVVLDTNVLLDLYSLPAPARELAFQVFRALDGRVWVPHQVMREFWRNRHSIIAKVPNASLPTETVRKELLAAVNTLRPDDELTPELIDLKSGINSTLDALAGALSDARGTPLNKKQILRDTSLDPVVSELAEILNGRVGSGFGTDEPDQVKEGLRRFSLQIPPGYEDAKDKERQIPENGTGDFLMWEQTLRHFEGRPDSGSFILVTNETKPDWRLSVVLGKKEELGFRPEMLMEALARTGQVPILLTTADFYRLMAKKTHVSSTASSQLITSATLTAEASSSTPATGWTQKAYERLLSLLYEDEYEAQADAILLAAQEGGFIDRDALYKQSGYSNDRSLRRFSLPASRITLTLIEEGLLREDAEPPLEAVYAGPGKATGYRVPGEFVHFVESRGSGLGF